MAHPGGPHFATVRCRKAPRLTRPTLLSDDQLARRRMRFPLRPYWGTIGARERSVISSPHIGHRAQDSAVGAGSLGFEYAYPMLDLRLVEFCLRLPDRLKLHPGGQRRTLIRSAMSGRLPDRVRLRDDKSWASVPFAISRFFAEAGDFMALFERHRSDPAVAAFVDMDFVIDELRQFAASAGNVGQLSVRQFHRIAQVCLWQEFQKSASALSG
jgi:asparagine synthase (glutamine-hydrolysing)